MPELTSKLGIKKPLGNETVSRSSHNENLDIIDEMAMREPFRLKNYSYDSTADQISITIGPGRGSFLGTVVDLSTVDSVVAISSPVPNTSYFVFLKSDGTFTTNTTGNFIGNAVLLHSITTGATVDVLSTNDYRGEISGDTQVLKTTVDSHISNDVIHVTQGDKDNWNSSYDDAVAWVQNFGLGVDPENIADCNALTGTGFYNTTVDTVNIPAGSTGGTLIHIDRDARPTQLFIEYSTNVMYTRSYIGTGWAAWARIATTDNDVDIAAPNFITGYFGRLSNNGGNGVPTSFGTMQKWPDGTLDYAAYMAFNANYDEDTGNWTAQRTGTYSMLIKVGHHRAMEYWSAGASADTTTPITWTKEKISTQEWIKGYGIGANAASMPTVNDANALLITGLYTTTSVFTGSPFAGTNGMNQGYLFHHQWSVNSNYAYQTHTQINGGKQKRIRYKDNGVWGPWQTMDVGRQSGYVDIPLAAGATTGSAVVTLPTGVFSTAPFVFLQPVSEYQSVMATIQHVAATDFTAKIFLDAGFTNSAGDGKIRVYWQAIPDTSGRALNGDESGQG